jgi:hypothetical protein
MAIVSRFSSKAATAAVAQLSLRAASYEVLLVHAPLVRISMHFRQKWL